MKLKLSLYLAATTFVFSGCAAPGPTDDELTGEANGSGGTTSTGDGDGTAVGDGDGDGTVVGDGDGTVGGDGDGTAVGDGDGDSTVPTPSGCAPIDPNNLLSDFESGEAKIAEVGGRAGSWYMSDDGSGSALPEKIPNTPLAAEAEGACSSTAAFQTSGSGFTGWGALVAVDLVPKVGDVKQPYDASAFSGIAFRARAASNVQVRVELATRDSMPEGGVCDPDAGTGEPGRCGDHFGMNVVLTSEWADVSIPFAQLTQKGWGLAASSFDSTGVYSVRLKVEGGDYDYTIDDVHFTN